MKNNYCVVSIMKDHRNHDGSLITGIRKRCRDKKTAVKEMRRLRKKEKNLFPREYFVIGVSLETN